MMDTTTVRFQVEQLRRICDAIGHSLSNRKDDELVLVQVGKLRSFAEELDDLLKLIEGVDVIGF